MVTLLDSDGTAIDNSGNHEPDELHGVVKILDLGLALLTEDQGERLTRFEGRATFRTWLTERGAPVMAWAGRFSAAVYPRVSERRGDEKKE